MSKNDLSKPKAIIEQLRKGKMLDHPGVAIHVKRALATNDYSSLLKFLTLHPFVQAMAANKIADEEFEKSLSPFRPYPTKKEAEEYLSGPLKLGYVNDTQSLFCINYNDLTLPILCAGRTGSGKSVFIKWLLNQIFSEQRGFNVLIPDLKKEYRHLLCTDNTNLKVLSQDKIMINPLQVPSWSTPQNNAMVFAKTFVSENYLLGTSENLIIDLLDRLYRARGILDGGINYPTLKDLYDLVSRMLLKTKTYRYAEVLLWLQNRLLPYVLSDSFNCQFGIPFEVFQKENLVLEMDQGFTERMYAFTVGHITGLLYNHNKLKDIGGLICHWVVADEARLLFNANRDTTNFGESYLSEIITKSRAYGISFLLASQESGSFNSTIRSLAYLKIAFPLNDDKDLKFIEESFGLTAEQKKELFKLPKYGVAVVRYGGYEKPFLMQVPDYQINNHLTNDELKRKMSSFYAELNLLIKKPPTPTSVEIKTDTTTNIPPSSSALLFYLGKFPFTKVSDLVQAPGFKSPSEVNKALDWLLQNDFVHIEKHRTSKTKMSMYTVLNDKAIRYLGIAGVPGKGSYEHSLYQHLIHVKLSKDGFIPKIEGRMKDSQKSIDVLAYSQDKKQITAFEVSLSLSNLNLNIVEDFRAGVSAVVIVVRDEKDLKKAEDIIANAGFPESISNRTTCVIIDSFY